MNEQFENEQISQFLNKQLQQEAEQIEKELMEHPELTDLSPDDGIKEKLYEQIREYEKQKVLSRLSAEDQEALQLGRMLQKEREEEKSQRFARKHRMGWKRAVAVAAVMVFVLGLSITSVGGPERVLEVMQQVVGERKVTKINSDNDKVMSSEGLAEEDAYQEIKDKLGIDPVRIASNEGDLEFLSVEIDTVLQTATLIYNKDQEIVSYIISISYSDGSFGTDIEDQLVDEYSKQEKGLDITVKEYNIAESNEKKYSAVFSRQSVYYQITGSMEKEDMEKILNSLSFL